MSIFKLLFALMAILAVGSIFFFSIEPPEIVPPENENTTIINSIRTNDIGVRSEALEIVKSCPKDNPECAVVTLFNSVIQKKLAQNSYADINAKTIKFASYLENIGIQTKLLLANNDKYIVGCGLSKKRLHEYLRNKNMQNPFYTDSMIIAAGQIWLTIPEIDNESNLGIKVNASSPIDIHVFNSTKNIDFSESRCTLTGVVDTINECVINKGNAILLHASNDQANIEISIALLDTIENNLATLNYKNQECLPFDFTKNTPWLNQAELPATGTLTILEPKHN